MPLQVRCGEFALALKPPPVLLQVVICPVGYDLRPGHGPFNGGNLCANELGYV
jgi:hypothetical protein